MGVEEVDREKAGLLLRVLTGTGFQLRPDPRVQQITHNLMRRAIGRESG